MHRAQAGRGMSAATPDERGRFGEFGGRFVPETVMGALDELEAGYAAARDDPGFRGRASTGSRATTSAGRRRCTWPSG